MIHSVPSADRVAAPWPSTGRLFDRLGQVIGAAVRWALRLCGFGNRMPELRMSRDWLEEYEQRSRKHSDRM
jgi:hypothetical protein